MEVELDRVPVGEKMRGDNILFSESNSRFLVEVAEKHRERFEEVMKDSVFALIGRTVEGEELKITSGEKLLISSDLEDLKAAWQRTLGGAL
jgi:phosphoribosylformylglycinamidine synthase